MTTAVMVPAISPTMSKRRLSENRIWSVPCRRAAGLVPPAGDLGSESSVTLVAMAFLNPRLDPDGLLHDEPPHVTATIITSSTRNLDIGPLTTTNSAIKEAEPEPCPPTHMD